MEGDGNAERQWTLMTDAAPGAQLRTGNPSSGRDLAHGNPAGGCAGASAKDDGRRSCARCFFIESKVHLI
jgi:hypothetical protein